MEPVVQPPRWDVSDVFPSLESREFAAGQEAIGADLVRLVGLYDRHDVRGGQPRQPTKEDLAAFDEVTQATNEFLEQARTLQAYVHAFITTDARDDRASSIQSQLQTQLADLRRLTTRFDAWVARLGADALIKGSQVAADHAHALRTATLSAAHQMTEAEESLYADLSLTGSSAWNKLHGDITSRMTADIRGEALPITVVRGMAYSPDADLRKDAYDAELQAFERWSVPLAAAMNGIKGEANTVNTRRGWEDSLAPALHANNVERPALEAMQEAVVASLPDFRRYLRAKAGALGHDGGLPWWDLFAPVGDNTSEITWDAATDAVREVFASYSPSLAKLAERAVSERWIDAEPRDGKRGGAFCMGVRQDESRILMNFDGSFGSVQTLAHELGHAYHNTTLAQRTPMQRRLPMALAETASIFCETMMVSTGLASAPESERFALLELDIRPALQVVVDIHSRFLFEKSVFEGRRQGTLSVADFNRLMLDAQRATYGDGLDPDHLHQYMWAVKPHYYSTAYYNWPYCFGLLFGIGLYAAYQADPEKFRSGYDDLLSSTGLASAAELAARFDIDIQSVGFWTSSLDVVRGRIDQFIALAEVGRGTASTVPAG
jgi:oligoendopeptidase F